MEESSLNFSLAAEVKFPVAVRAYGDRVGRSIRAAFGQRPDMVYLKVWQTIGANEGSRLLT